MYQPPSARFHPPSPTPSSSEFYIVTSVAYSTSNVDAPRSSFAGMIFDVTERSVPDGAPAPRPALLVVRHSPTSLVAVIFQRSCNLLRWHVTNGDRSGVVVIAGVDRGPWQFEHRLYGGLLTIGDQSRLCKPRLWRRPGLIRRNNCSRLISGHNTLRVATRLIEWVYFGDLIVYIDGKPVYRGPAS